MKGLDVYKTKDGFTVARLHYTADPDKDPAINPAWIENSLKGTPGGRNGHLWRKEYEIDFSAYAGQLLCGQIINKHRDKIIKHVIAESLWNFYGSMDWGRNNPASFHVYAVDRQGIIYSIYEIYLRDVSIPDFVSLIKACEWYQLLKWISADPSIWNNNQETKDGLRSLNDMFIDEGLTLFKASNRNEELAINELMDRWDKLDTQEPGFIISPKCQKQVWEFENLRYQELSTAMLDRVNNKENLVDKDNHSWDDYKYFISTYFSNANPEPVQKSHPDSLAAIIKKQEEYKSDWRSKYKKDIVRS